jgi:hypothetical protein
MFTRIGAFGLKIKRDQDFKSQKAPPFFFLLFTGAGANTPTTT